MDRFRIVPYVLAITVLPLWGLAQTDPQPEAAPPQAIDAAAAARYLEALLPSPQRLLEGERLVAALGANRYSEREAATRTLLEMPLPPLAALRTAAAGADFEIAQRAQELLEQLVIRNRDQHRMILLRVSSAPLTGLASVLLRALPTFSDDPELRQLAYRALSATTSSDDLPLLRATLADDHPLRRAAAIATLSAHATPADLDAFAERLQDPSWLVQDAAALALARYGDARCLAALIAQLDAEEDARRHAALLVLRRLSGQQFGFYPHAPAAERRAAVLRWAQWAEQAAAAKSLVPLRMAPAVTYDKILACPYGSQQLIEIDAEGRQTTIARDLPYAWGCHGTVDGHRLVVDINLKVLQEYDIHGKLLRQLQTPGDATSVQPLDDGNVLLALSDAGLVVELDLQGSTVWKLDLGTRVSCAQRLACGTTVLCLQERGEIIDVDRSGKVLARIAGLQRPHTIQRLENGNTLVVEFGPGHAAEYAPAGARVWTYSKLDNPAQAQRLPSGNTLISDSTGLHEVTPAGVLVRSIPMSRARFHRY